MAERHADVVKGEQDLIGKDETIRILRAEMDAEYSRQTVQFKAMTAAVRAKANELQLLDQVCSLVSDAATFLKEGRASSQKNEKYRSIF